MMEELDILNAVLNGGQLAFMVWLIMDMRKQQQSTDAKIWALLREMASKRGVDANAFADENGFSR